MHAHLTGDEIACVKILGRLYEESRFDWEGVDWQAIGLTDANAFQVLSTMEHIGAISDVGHGEQTFEMFTIQQRARQIVREIEENERSKKDADEKRDAVDSIRSAARQNPFIAWAIIIAGLVLFLVTLIAQFTTILKNFGAL